MARLAVPEDDTEESRGRREAAIRLRNLQVNRPHPPGVKDQPLAFFRAKRRLADLPNLALSGRSRRGFAGNMGLG